MTDSKNQGQGSKKQERPSNTSFNGVKSAIDTLTNEMKTNRAEQQKRKEEDNKWPKQTAIAAVIYTFITAIILLVTAYQTYLMRANNVVSQRAFVFPTIAQPTPAIDQANNQPISWNVFISLTNSGNTPTKDLIFFLKCAPSAEEIQEP